MDSDYSSQGRYVFRCLVCLTITTLIMLQFINISDMNHKILQLEEDLSKVNQKYFNILQNERKRTHRVKQAQDHLTAINCSSQDTVNCISYDRQIVDFALQSAGGRVIGIGDTIEHTINESPITWILHMLESWMCRECQARVLIQPGSLPGECWAFKGSQGEVVIKLLGTVRVSGITVEHISTNISPTREISSAPRQLQIEGLQFRADPYPHDFAIFEYDKDGKPIQYFNILHHSPKGYNLIRIRVLSNWGHPVYTCIYRVRVHGELVWGQKPALS